MSFENANLEVCIRAALNIPEAVLTPSDAQTLIELECDGSSFQPERIVSLGGLEAFTNLRTLVLRDNVFITDISPVAGLTQLTELGLDNNSIGDFTSVAGLTQLTALRLSDNMISDVTPVAGLTQLESLQLANNSISILTPLVANTEFSPGFMEFSGNPLDMDDCPDLQALINRGAFVIHNVFCAP